MSATYVVQLTFPASAPTPEQRDAQQQFLKGLLEEGVLVLAGRFADERGGGMAVLEAASIAEARELYAKSPFVEASLVEWDVREWDVTWRRNG